MRRASAGDAGDEDTLGDGEFAAQPVVSRQPTGWPSPAEDHTEPTLDLTEFVMRHPAATFFLQADSSAMLGAGIYPRDVLVVDRSLAPTDGCVVVAAVEGELVVRRYHPVPGGVALLAEHPDYAPIRVRGEQEVIVWGVVTHVVHSFPS
jgi:DNA polymerase V